MSSTSGSGSAKNNPADFLKTILGRPVVVKLNSGVDYRGVLACLDGYMNIAMEQTEEYVNGQLKAKYGDAFIRGNNGGPCPALVRTLLHASRQLTRTPRSRSPVHFHSKKKSLTLLLQLIWPPYPDVLCESALPVRRPASSGVNGGVVTS